MVEPNEEFDARKIREEKWPELENMVIHGKGLRRRNTCSTETGDEDYREQEVADCCDTSPTRLRRDERDGSRIATFLDLKD